MFDPVSSFSEASGLMIAYYIIPILSMGIRYSEGALIPDDLLGGREEPTGRRRQYIPSADPGLRLPHMNVRVLASEV